MNEFNNERLQNILIHYTSDWHSEIVEPMRHLPAGEVHHSGKLSYFNFELEIMNCEKQQRDERHQTWLHCCY